MPGRELDRSELAAGELIACMIGGLAVPTDVEGARDAIVDFMIMDLCRT